MANLKEVKSRIASTKNIHKITKAMELVSVSKMRRATSQVLASRPYAQESWRILQELVEKVDPKHHPLLFGQREKQKVLLIVMTSDRGMCGAFNSEILKNVDRFIPEICPGAEVDFVSVGKKGREGIVRRHLNLSAVFDETTLVPNVAGVRAIAKLSIEEFLAGRYDHIFVLYTDFISTISQHAVYHQLLPLTPDTDMQRFESNLKKKEQDMRQMREFEFVFEPNRDEVLSSLLPRLVETQLYQFLLESAASEHAARMVAMKNASDAASDIVGDLTFTYNQLRQASITQEIAEISAGKAVIE